MGMAKTSKTTETATKVYAKAHQDVDALLEIIRARMPQKDCRTADWSDAGTMQSLRQKLAQIAAGFDLADGDEKAAGARLELEIARVAKERY